MIKLKQPWPHQVRSKEKLRENLRLDILRQLLCVPTGGGKTEIAMSIIVDAYLKGSHTAFICDMQTLVHQTSERFANAGIPHGVAMGQTTHGRNELIQICSAQTLETRGFLTAGMPMLEGVYAERPLKLAILDECHVVRRQLIATLIDKKIPIIGLTATPLTDGLDSIYQAIVNVTTTEKLIKEGYLAPLRVVSPKARVDTKNVRQNEKGEWVREDLSNRVLRIVGEIVPEWERADERVFRGAGQDFSLLRVRSRLRGDGGKIQAGRLRLPRHPLPPDVRSETADHRGLQGGPPHGTYLLHRAHEGLRRPRGPVPDRRLSASEESVSGDPETRPRDAHCRRQEIRSGDRPRGQLSRLLWAR